MLDDLNTPAAIASAIEGAKLIQGMGANLNAASAQSALRFVDRTTDLLGIVQNERDTETTAGPAGDDFTALVESLLTQREEARRARDFEKADGIRAKIEEMGVEVMDSPDGPTWRKKTVV